MVPEKLEKRNEALYKKLVPGSGDADTLEGEMLRAINKIVYRYYNDGDYYHEGYGIETAAPAHAFLLNLDYSGGYDSKDDDLNNLQVALYRILDPDNRPYGKDYEDSLNDALIKILEYIEGRKKYATNTYDMLDADPLFEEEEPIYGCTDPEAENYDWEADEDDGSCYYREDDDEDDYAKGGLLRVLKDSGFNHHKGSPKNELKHNRGRYVATIGKDNMGEVVHLDKYTPNTKRFISSTSFDNPKKLADYFSKNQLYAKGGSVDEEWTRASAKNIYERSGKDIMKLRRTFLQLADTDEKYGDKELAELRRKIVSEYQSKEPKIMAKGGDLKAKHVLHIDGQNWFLEKIDNTHFYMSNDKDFRGMAHHVGQHRGEPYYEEVRQWLKDTYAKGGEIPSKIKEEFDKKIKNKKFAKAYLGEIEDEDDYEWSYKSGLKDYFEEWKDDNQTFKIHNELRRLKAKGVRNVTLNGFDESILYVIDGKYNDYEIKKNEDGNYSTTFAKGGINKLRLKKGDTVYVAGKRHTNMSLGNTYHTVRVYVNDRLIGKTESPVYGYENAYLDTGRKILFEKYNKPYGFEIDSPLSKLKEKNVKFLYSVKDYKTKKELY